MKRPSWDEYFIQQCDLVATRSTCDRKHIGAVIVRDKRVIASGYNGSLPGMEHCDCVGCDMENSHCVRTIHAEASCIVECAKRGVSTENATIYCNTFPCWNCFKMIVSAGIIEIVFRDEYRADLKNKVVETAGKIPGFILRQFNKSDETETIIKKINNIGKKQKRINVIGETQNKIDASEVAKALGAEKLGNYPIPPYLRKKKNE